jgi:predicted RNase H-like nuclease (RuvC/YqgF family)
MSLCGLNGRSGITSDMMSREDSSAQMQLSTATRENEVLRKALEQREQENSRLHQTQQEYQDMIEAQEAELLRLRKKNAAIAVKEDDRVGELEKLIAALKADLEAKDIEITRFKRIARIDTFRRDNGSDEDAALQSSDGPAGFHRRLKAMQKGDTISVWEKDKFKAQFLSLSEDFKQVRIAVNSKKKPSDIRESFPLCLVT